MATINNSSEKKKRVTVTTVRTGVEDAMHTIALREIKKGKHRSIDERVQMLLTGSKRRPMSPIKMIRHGLHAASVKRVQERLGFIKPDPVLDVIGISKRTYERRLKHGESLTPLEADRLYRLAKIEAKAQEVFQDESTAVAWLRHHNRALGDTPINMLDTEAGTEMVERVLTRIEHGVYS